MTSIRLILTGLLSVILVGVSPGASSIPNSFNEINELPVSEVLADLRCVGGSKKKGVRKIPRSILKIAAFKPQRLKLFLAVFSTRSSTYFSFKAQGHRLSNGMVAPMLL